ncbi:unnamed protein product [Arctia plantaginis]|uniref:Uncharacterized protein n=1 Tax=Arctia plantaginis TaxID=874455 RepID=A0A8S0Z450_ARCPL|nr:unnamed protein product [Arctia plantaginis]CAB3261720.1 unnamed protein product [Arctia plantaginis]
MNMSLDRSGLSADEYYATALQIFDYCGAESTGTLRVDTLMDKFAPFVKTNKAEYSYLKSLLDPAEDNPEISVTMLAKTLHKYSEDQKSKVDLDESFNLLKSGQAPQDSDSGISTDGFQLLEELQCELREKSHLAHQLRSQLDFTDRQHEEALAALTADRDALRTHLNILREENSNLNHIRHDYEEVCERLCSNDRALDESRREIEAFRRKNKIMTEQVSLLENEKLTLQELLAKSKAECHRINEMYAARQSALLEQNEALRTEHADLSARLQDQEEFVQQMIKEKVLLEMELKDLLNKSNQTQLRMDRSIDISYTDEQMLTALDSLNVDSRFSQDNRILDEESFINALKEDHGRTTNMSLFDEIRLSFSNMSRFNATGNNSIVGDKHLDSFACDTSFIAVGTQTDIEVFDDHNRSSLSIDTQTDIESYFNGDNVQNVNTVPFIAIGTQTDNSANNACLNTAETQTDWIDTSDNNNNHAKCHECEKANVYTTKLEKDVVMSNHAVAEMQLELNKYENKLNVLEKFIEERNERNSFLQDIIKSLETKIDILQNACIKQKERLDSLTQDEYVVKNKCDLSSVSTQADIPCLDCEKRTVGRHRHLRRFFWSPLKCLFQMFAVMCFVCACAVLYGVSRRARPACPRDAVPWRWLHAQDLVDLLLRIDYVADVPM